MIAVHAKWPMRVATAAAMRDMVDGGLMAMGSDDWILRLGEMASRQDRLNREAIHPDWRHHKTPFYRAIWMECAELLDHYGWKWWQAHRVDFHAVRLEIVDIWHFLLSDIIIADSVEQVARRMMAISKPDYGMNMALFRDAVEELAHAALDREPRHHLSPFMHVMNALPMTLDGLYKGYVGKSVLNAFRQAHGYKDGSYVKRWEGREDNHHLAEIVADLDPSPATGTFAQEVWKGVAGRYADMAVDSAETAEFMGTVPQAVIFDPPEDLWPEGSR